MKHKAPETCQTCIFYQPDGKTPALMQGTGGRTLKVLTEAGGGA